MLMTTCSLEHGPECDPKEPKDPSCNFPATSPPMGTKWVLVASTWQPTRTLTKINEMGQHSSVHYGRMVWTWETRPVL